MAKISNVTARTFCAHINNSLVYSLITLCFHSSLLMGRSCLPSCVCVFFFPQRLPKSQPREALPIPLAGTVPVAVSAGTWWLARAISSATCTCLISIIFTPYFGFCTGERAILKSLSSLLSDNSIIQLPSFTCRSFFHSSVK